MDGDLVNYDSIDVIVEQLQEASSPTDSFRQEHIFYSLLEYCGENETFAAKIDMMYRFNQGQNCLINMREGRMADADHVLGIIESEPLELQSEISRLGMEALESAIVGYRHYVGLDYEASLACMDRCNQCYEQLYHGGFTRILLAQVDLRLNVLRVHVAAGKLDRAVESGIDILKVLYGGSNKFWAHNIDLASMFAPNEFDPISKFFANAVITKIISTNDDATIRMFFLQLFAALPYWKQSGVRAAFEQYSYLFEDVNADGLDREFLRSVSLPDLPNTLQYLLVSTHLKKSLKTAGSPALNIIDAYFASLPETNSLRKSSWCA
jgi:hypothetical protein